MSKNVLVTTDETSNKVAIHRETRQQCERTLRIPSGLKPIELAEWHRLVAEREGQPDGLLPGDAPFLKVAAWTFGRIVRIRPWLVALASRRAYDIGITPLLRMYIGLCQSLGCTPAVPNRSHHERS